MSTPLRTDAFMRDALDAWGDAVYRLALSQTHSTADAQDIAQEVFLRLLRSTTPFKSDEHLKAWLLRVTVNCCHDLQRSVWRARVDSLDESPTTGNGGDTAHRTEVPSGDQTPEDETVAALTRNPVWDALRLLSPRPTARNPPALCRGIRRGPDRPHHGVQARYRAHAPASRAQAAP